MVYEFKFPDVGEGITEGELVKWHVKISDKVKVDQVLAEVETDKAVVEIPSPKAGKILKLHFKEGDTMKVGDAMITIGEGGEVPIKEEKSKEMPTESHTQTIKHHIKREAEKGTSVVGSLEEATEKDILPAPKEANVEKFKTNKILAIPAVRALAKKLKVNIENIKGTGSDGRVIVQDVKAATGKISEEKPKQSEIKHVRKYDIYGYIEHVPLKGMRKTIAVNMAKSIYTSPHVAHMDESNVSHLYNIRKKEKKAAEKKGIKLTFLPFIIKAVAQALKEHPYLNSTLEGDDIILKKYYNIGVAVDTEAGLMVPVVKGVDDKSIFQIAKDVQDLAEKARTRKIDVSDLKGGTFTITNVGSIGGLFATPIINPGEVAILALGRIQDKLVPDKVKKIKLIKSLSFSISFDHRVVDGAEVARFANKLKQYIEDPDLLLAEIS
jgi:pyruvate dehydrogenase E2 component (dihydrolipoamide acetyltransferase)